MDLCFTLVIKCENGYQASYQMAYQPCPVWMQGEEYVVNMCDDGLQYQAGGFKKLLNFHESNNGRSIHPDKICILICEESWINNVGLFKNEIFNTIISDIEGEGFSVKLIRI